jgi:hypothetical protein
MSDASRSFEPSRGRSPGSASVSARFIRSQALTQFQVRHAAIVPGRSFGAGAAWRNQHVAVKSVTVGTVNLFFPSFCDGRPL